MTHGSLHNLMMSNTKPVTPEVGMGATEIMWTDRHAYTVVEVRSPKRIIVQQDISTRTDGNEMSDAQSYTFTPNPNGSKYELTLRRDGKWRQVGCTKGDNTFSLGFRSTYHDYSF